MAYIQGESRSQTSLFPISLEELIPKDHPIRVIAPNVARLSLVQLAPIIYFSIPFDELMASSTTRRATLVWTPLTRDGGAALARSYSLYSLTERRNIDLFHNSFYKVTE